MKAYTGRRIRIYEYGEHINAYEDNSRYELKDTGKTGRLLEIDVRFGQVMVEDEAGNLIKLHHKLVRLV